METNGIHLHEEPMQLIPNDEWIASKIDWKNSILFSGEYAYCWINFDVDSVLSAHPMPEKPPIGTVTPAGDLLHPQIGRWRRTKFSTRRGRPSLPWDQFHLEVAALAISNALPQKKEAAIQHFESWFKEKLGLQVGRSSISQKLTPYYDRFVRGQPKIPSD